MTSDSCMQPPFLSFYLLSDSYIVIKFLLYIIAEFSVFIFPTSCPERALTLYRSSATSQHPNPTFLHTLQTPNDAPPLQHPRSFNSHHLTPRPRPSHPTTHASLPIHQCHHDVLRNSDRHEGGGDRDCDGDFYGYRELKGTIGGKER